MVQLCEAIGNSKVKLNSIPNISLPHVKLRFHGSIMKIASKSMPMFIGSPKKIRSSVAPGLLRERDRQQYVDPPPAKFSGLFIQLIAPCYPHKIIYIYTSGGTKFMFLGSFTKHPSQSTADHMFKSVLCGRCGTINYHPLIFLKILKLLEGGNATGVRQNSMLQFYAKGFQKKCDRGTTKLHASILRKKDFRRRNQTYSPVDKRNFRPTSASRHVCSSAGTEDGDRHVMWSNDQAEARAKISRWLGNSH